MRSKEGGVFFHSKSHRGDKSRNIPGLVGEAHLCLQGLMGNAVLWSCPQARRCWHPSHLTWLPTPSSRGPGVVRPLQAWGGLSRARPCGAPGWVLLLTRYSWGWVTAVLPLSSHTQAGGHLREVEVVGPGTWGPRTFPAADLPQWVSEVRSRQPSLSAGV